DIGTIEHVADLLLEELSKALAGPAGLVDHMDTPQGALLHSHFYHAALHFLWRQINGMKDIAAVAQKQGQSIGDLMQLTDRLRLGAARTPQGETLIDLRRIETVSTCVIDTVQRKRGDLQAELVLSGVQIWSVAHHPAAHTQQRDQQPHQNTVYPKSYGHF